MAKSSIRPELFDRLLIVVFGVLVPFALGSSTRIFNDGDVSWHIAAGQWMIEHGAVPQADVFSFTKAGEKWVAFEWLSDVVLALAFQLNGYAGVAVTVSLAMIALNLLTILAIRRWASPVAQLASLFALNAALIPFMLARPHVFAWPLLAGWIIILLRARDRGVAPPLTAAILMILWANLHGSWAIGLVIAGVFALEAMIEARWQRKALLGWLAFGVASALAAMLTPNGIAGFLHPLHVAQLETLPLILEWMPSDPNRTPLFYGVLVVTLAAMLWRGVRLEPVRAMLLAALVGLALLQMRHQAVLAIVATLLLARPFAEAGGAGAERAPLLDGDRRKTRVAAIGLGLTIAVLALVRALVPLTPAQNGANPRDALAAVPPALRGRPVFNGYTIGGPLILAGIRPFIDGRQDLYGDRFLTDYKRILDGDKAAFDVAAKRWAIEWTILPADDVGLLVELDRSAGWRRLYADKAAVIHVRSRNQRTPPSDGQVPSLAAPN